MANKLKILATCALMLSQLAFLAAAEIKPALDAPQAHEPENSLQMFRVDAAFRVELVAAEPHLADPVATCFDASGHIFACEIHGYNLDGYFDVVQLNHAGKLDKRRCCQSESEPINSRASCCRSGV